MAKTPKLLTGQVAVVTGGARGIGKATTKAMAAKGMKVAIGDLDLDVASATASELGPNVHAYRVDVTDPASFEELVAAAERDLGPMDVLINNAGIMPVGVFMDESDASTKRQIDINVHGVLTGCKLALPRFTARGRGHLVNIASAAGKGGFPGVATYCGTKHFVVGFSEAIRGELRDTGVEVTCVMPSFVNTELVSGLGSARGVKNAAPEDVADAIVEALEVPRFDVYVPKSVGVINKVMGVLPRSAREATARALKADRVMLEVDDSQRAAYELRAAKSEPGLEPGSEQKELTQG